MTEPIRVNNPADEGRASTTNKLSTNTPSIPLLELNLYGEGSITVLYEKLPEQSRNLLNTAGA